MMTNKSHNLSKNPNKNPSQSSSQNLSQNWMALDWGSSYLRVWLLSGEGEILAKKTTNQGASGLNTVDFASIFNNLVQEISPNNLSIDAIICGMAGAYQRWQETPYLNTPVLVENIAQNLHKVTDFLKAEVLIIPGVAQKNPAEVMRGEETQILGLMSLQKNTSAVVCLPGTHSKWVRVNNGSIVEFKTVITGELYALLCKYSMLNSQVSTEKINQKAFIAAVLKAFKQPENITNYLFQIRAQFLLNRTKVLAAQGQISGYLIGLELAATQNYWQNHAAGVVLIGEKRLVDLYQYALKQLNVKTTVLDSLVLSLAGLTKIHQLNKQ